MVRGFLNDGKIDYKSHHSVDSIAFGHCSYSYRNLGRLSKLKIFQDHQTFKVEVDGKMCFQTDKVQIPINYHWGVTAVSAETPDSYEINALKVTAHTYDFEAQKAPPPSQPASQPRKGNDGDTLFSILGRSSPLDQPKEVDPNKVPVAEQFADLHNRLHAVHQHITGNHQDFVAISKRLEEQLRGIESLLNDRPPPPPPPPSQHNEIRELKEKLELMETRLQHIQSAVGDRWHIEDLKRTVEESHNVLLKKAPGTGMLLFIIMGSQAVLVAGYVLYKRRRANGPKKYL